MKNDIPVTVGFRRQAHYDGAQANFAGDLGVGSDPGLIGKIKEADLILALGSRLGDAVTQGYTLLDMAGAVPIIQVLPEGSEIGRVFRPALGIEVDGCGVCRDADRVAHEIDERTGQLGVRERVVGRPAVERGDRLGVAVLAFRPQPDRQLVDLVQPALGRDLDERDR